MTAYKVSYPKTTYSEGYITVSEKSFYTVLLENPNEVTLSAMAEAEEIQDRPGFGDFDALMGALGRDEGV